MLQKINISIEKNCEDLKRASFMYRLAITALLFAAIVGVSHASVPESEKDDRNIVVVSVPFPAGFIGTIGNNANKADDITTFATLGIQAFAFTQMNELGQFELQGNDLAGGIRIITQNGQVIEVFGAINWRITEQGSVEAFGFIPAANTPSTLFAYGNNQTYTISSTSNFGLVKIGSTFSFTNGDDISGNAASAKNLLDDLNQYLDDVNNNPDKPIGPVTVNFLTTPDTTPTVTGTVTLQTSESLGVIINGFYYTTSNGLVVNNDTWSVIIPNDMALTVQTTYDVTAIITNTSGLTLTDATSGELAIVPPDVTPPVITGPSGVPGAATDLKEIPDATTPVHTFSANEAVTWTLEGADAAKFVINANGSLSFIDPPSYENPADIGGTAGDNDYIVVVRATDLQGNTSFQTVTVRVTPLADVSVSKVLTTAGPFYVGQEVTYEITVSNAGPSAALSVVITDTPTNLSITGVASTGSISTCTAFPCNIPALGSGTSGVITVTATIDVAGSFSNIAAISTISQDPNLENNDFETDLEEAFGEAELVTVKTLHAGSSTPGVGQSITYSITVTNNGPDSATGISLTDQVPAGLTYAGHIADKGTYISGSGVWSGFSLASGDFAVLELTATVDATTEGQTITNTSTAATSDQTDPTTDGDDLSESVTVIAQADLAIAKAASSATPAVGSTVTFTLTAANAGPSGATGVVVTDLLPSGYSYVGSTPSVGSYDQATGAWTIGALASGADATLEIEATVLATGSYANTATIAGDQADPDLDDNTDTNTPVPVNVILAVADTFGPVNGADGGTTGSVLANDTLNGDTASTTTVVITVQTPATPINAGQVPSLNTSTGLVSVPAGTPAGTYDIVYEICEVGNPDNCDTATITVMVIQDIEETISGVKFNDVNGDGVRNENEPGLAGWLIYVDVNTNGQFDENEPSTLSGPDGSWIITGIPLGEVVIREVIRVDSEWVQTFPGIDADNQHVVTVAENQTISELLFGNHLLVDENAVASITGYKWHDIDGNGSKDADEPFMANWTIFLDLNNNGVLDAEEPLHVTDQDGSFTFEDMQLGAYVVREIMQDGWLQTNPGRGVNSARNVTLSTGGAAETAVFGNAMPVTITGLVWRDQNANSNMDVQEPMLGEWIIFLDANGNGVFDNDEIFTTTNTDGYFEFMGLIPGMYNVVAVNPTDWVQIYPGSNGYHTFTLRSGETASGDFGIAHVDDLQVVEPEPSTIEGNIWYDYAEDAVWDHKVHLDRTDYVNWEVSVEGWQVTLSGTSLSGEPVQMTTFTRPDGSYSFQNVPAGEYRVNREYREDWVPSFPLLEWDNPQGQYHIIRVNGGYGGLASTERRIHAGNEHNWIDDLEKGADQLYVGVYLHIDTNGDGDSDTKFFVSGPMSMAWDKAASRMSKYEIRSIDLIGTSKEYGRVEMSNHRSRNILGELQGEPGDSLVASQMDIPFELVVGGTRWILPDSQTPTIEGLVSQMLPYNQKHVSVENNHVEFFDVFGNKLGKLITMELMPLYGADFGSNQSLFGTAPAQKYPVIIEDAGARHVLHHYEPHRDLFLGTGFASTQIFVRNISNASMGATKVHNTAENGVLFLTPVKSGDTTQIQVHMDGDGYLHAWFDLNQDGVWSAEEKLVEGLFLEKGLRIVSMDIPVGAVAGQTYARFRLSPNPTLDSATGVLSGGEIEDYQVQILGAGGTVQGTIWIDLNANGIRDQNEPGAGGIKVFADLNSNGALEQDEPSTFTTANGSYSLGGIASGSVHIQPDYAGKWMVTNIAGSSYIVATIVDGRVLSGVNFGIVSITTSISEDATVPREFGLDQNYPNPFNPSTTIRYRLAESSIVNLVVYDMNGRVVSTLVNDHQNAGEYTVSFDASSLSSGVYVYRLSAGTHVYTHKLTLIK